MKRARKILSVLLLVAIQIVAVCFVVDLVFGKYEKDHLYSHASWDAASYSLDDMLLNDHEGVVAKKKAPGEYRVLAFGDSFTYAVTRPEYGLCAELQRRLDAAGDGRRVRVVNLGFPSISFPEYLERFFFWNQALEYDAVIFNVYLGNDFNDVRKTPYDPGAFADRLAEVRRRGQAYGVYSLVPHDNYFRFLDFIKAQFLFKLQSDAGFRKMLFLPELKKPEELPASTASAASSSASTASAASSSASTASAASVASSSAEPLYRSLLPLSPEQLASEMRSSVKPFFRETMFAYRNNLPWYQLFLATAARVAASGKPVLVTLFPPLCAVSPEVGRAAARDLGADPETMDLGLPGRVTRELARRVGLPQEDVLDLTPCLAARTPSGQETYTGVDTHWSPAGNAWVADILAGYLKARWFGLPDPGAAACAPPARPAFEAIPPDLDVPVGPQQALAASIVAGRLQEN